MPKSRSRGKKENLPKELFTSWLEQAGERQDISLAKSCRPPKTGEAKLPRPRSRTDTRKFSYNGSIKSRAEGERKQCGKAKEKPTRHGGIAGNRVGFEIELNPGDRASRRIIEIECITGTREAVRKRGCQRGPFCRRVTEQR